jgi:putative glutathione S-transferase
MNISALIMVFTWQGLLKLRRLADYPALSGYLKELFQIAGVRETTNFDYIKRHYYFSHTMINPTQIVPVWPIMELESAHGRENL